MQKTLVGVENNLLNCGDAVLHRRRFNPWCLYVCVFAHASKVHRKDVCMQSLIDVCDNFPVGGEQFAEL